MLRKNLSLALRHLRKSRMHSFINITGLSIGMAVSILIALWIIDECSYDRNNPAYDRIARVMQTGTLNGSHYTYSSMPIPLAGELRTRYGNHFKYVVPSYWARDYILSAGDGAEDKKISQRGRFMDADAPYLLSLNMVEGSRDALNDLHSILLSASAAKNLFGRVDPIGRRIKIDNTMVVKVGGVYEDISANSSFSGVLFIAPWKLLLSTDEPTIQPFQTDWGWDAIEIYVQLADNAEAGRVSAIIRNSTFDHLKGNNVQASYHPVVFLQQMSRWHLYSEYKDGVNTGGGIQTVWLLGAIGLGVLLLACINFMNLSTARSEKRAKEVGIRKAIGSRRGQLIGQFFSESLLAVGIAFGFALILVWMALPYFNEVAGKQIAMSLARPWFWLGALGFSLLTGLLAGSYPALYLSSFRPIKVLKTGSGLGRGGALARQALVVFQFSISTALIIGVLVVFHQVGFAKSRTVGYDRQGLISIPLNTPEVKENETVLRNALCQSGVISDMAASSSPATAIWLNLGGFDWPGKQQDVQAEFGTVAVTQEYGKTLGWHFLQGRDFSRDFPTDSSGLVLNEAAVKYMGLQDPVGKVIRWDGQPYRVLGVIRDMLMESPYEPVRQVIYHLSAPADNHFFIARLKPGLPIQDALRRMRSLFQKYAPSTPFDYKFVDEEYGKKFAAEERTGTLSGLFAILAVLISCLGIFAMASFMAERRAKEIGIRKVLGASVVQLSGLLSKEFLALSGIALVIAMPVAYLFMHQWLGGYSYHSGIPWWIFAGTASGALAITLGTVSLQAIKAAMSNPVKALRAE